MKKILIASICLCFIIIYANLSIAHHPKTPAEIEGVKNVSAGEVKTLIGKKDVFLIDSRKVKYYVRGHLENAVSLPFKWETFGEIQTRKGTYDMSKLPLNKNTRVIFYSDGEHNWDSYHSEKKAKSAGYENIMWFKGGLKSWIENGYPVDK
jgi:rhodanese-related sulfurtransferase